MDKSMEMARADARASATDGKGGATRSGAAKIAISVFGSALTVAVALAALILTSAHYTREQFHDQNELMRRHFTEQNEQMRRHFTEQLDLMRAHSDSQFAQVREDLREFRGDLDEVREDLRVLAERQAKVEGLLLAAHRPGTAASSEPRSAHSSLSRPGDPASE